MTFANGARRKKMRTRIISLVMVLALVFTLLPVYAIADADTMGGAYLGMHVLDPQLAIENLKELAKR